MIVAIDGPAGSGKSTIARLLANRLGFSYLDSGALYRAATWAVLEKKIEVNDEDRVCEALKKVKINFKYDLNFKVFVDSKEVTREIRKPFVSQAVSLVSSYPKVRQIITNIQKKNVKENTVVEGRDISTVVFPQADIKLFIEASFEERVRRRWEDWQRQGIKSTFEQARADILLRDRLDSSRKYAPLKKLAQAIVIDTTNLTPEETVEKIIQLIKSKERKK